MVVHQDFHRLVKQNAAKEGKSIIKYTKGLSEIARKDEEELQKRLFKLRF